MSEGIDLDYTTLLNWIEKGDRETQKTALEQLCMTILISDNVDRCFESCPPREFLPALCRIFLDDSSPVANLETAARAMTYYMDMSNECSKRIVTVEGTVKSVCDRIGLISVDESANKELAEQCVKVLEHICQREANLVHEAGGFLRLLELVRDKIDVIHNDTLRSAMTVITRLCTKLDTNQALQSGYCVTLAKLLMHADLKVSESSLRSIAAIVDRFIRSDMDPFDFVEDCGLIDLLLGLIIEKNEESYEYVLSGKPISFISIVLSLLSNLCRGSAASTDLVVRSGKLVSVLKAVMTNKDERCVMDGLRLTDMILSLMCEGRKVFVKGNPSSSSLDVTPMPPSVLQKYKQVIEHIRNKDFVSLREAFETGTFDVDYTDDIGQSLLNWVAAYGTLEMAQFLLEKGANVDGGNRSSSLHYAAIFGRPDIARLLIDRGANPELRDEEGKTPLEKARERHEDGHRQVARLLENPLTKQNSGQSIVSVDDAVSQRIFSLLVPILCTVNKATLLTEVKRSSISLIRKCVNHIPIGSLRSAIVVDNFNNEFAEKFLGLLENTLDREQDLDVREQLLLMMENLLDRDMEFWIQQIARLGVYMKVEALATEAIADGRDYSNADIPEGTTIIMRPIPTIMPASSVSGPSSSRVVGNIPVPVTFYGTDRVVFMRPNSAIGANISEMSKQLVSDATSAVSSITRMRSGIKNIHWNGWRILFVDGVTFVWCDMICLKFDADGTAVYFSADCIGKHLLFGTRAVQDTTENRIEFRSQFIVAKENAVDEEMERGFEKQAAYGFMDWTIARVDANKIRITNSNFNNAKVDILDASGSFTYTAEDNSVSKVLARVPLPEIFSTGFMKGFSVDKEFSKRLKIKELAVSLWDKHLKNCKNNLRDELRALKDNADSIVKLFDEELTPDAERVLYNQLEQVRNALMTDNTLSIFEIAHSGIVDTFCYGLAICIDQPKGAIAAIFRRVFCEEHIISIIIRKLVLVMEALESFPVVVYNKPNTSITGMRLLNKRFHLVLEQADPKNWLQQKLINQTGRKMKADPLCSGSHLKHYLLQKLSKFWYDVDKNRLTFVRNILECKANNEELVFDFFHDFDARGILFYIGTNGLTENKYENPASAGLVKALSSEGKHVPFDPVAEILSRSAKPMNCHTSDVLGSYFIFDIGVYVHPTAYTLRHSRGYNNSALRNWTFEGSADNKRWYVIARHKNDETLSNEASSASWAVNPNTDVALRYFRVVQQGFNSSGRTYFLSLSGFELYGSIVDVVTDALPTLDVPRLYTSPSSSRVGTVAVPKNRWSQNLPPSIRHDMDNDDDTFEARRAAFRSLFTVDALADQAVDDEALLARGRHSRGKSHSSKKSEFEGLSIGALDNSSPPVSLKDAANQPRARFVYPITSVPVIQCPPRSVKRMYRPSADFKIDYSFPAAKCGFIVKNVRIDATRDKLYGRIVKMGEENGFVHVLWENGTCEKVTYGDETNDVVVVQNQYHQDEQPQQTDVPGPSNVESTSTGQPASSTISQKSMSTTNLFDRKKSHSSVAATNQAASAESLQHQTPSLENLLSRARVFHERIPEAGDEQSPANTPEPTSNELNVSPSVAASTFGGGSHPVLSHTRRSVDSEASSTRAQNYAHLPERAESDEDDDDNDNDNDQADYPPHTGSDDSIPVYNPILESYDDYDNGGRASDEFMLEQLGQVLSGEIGHAGSADRHESAGQGRYPSYAEAIRTVMDQVMNIERANEEIEEEISFNDEYEEDATDGTEEDFDEMLNQGIQQVAAEDATAAFGDRFAYRAFQNPPPVMGEGFEGHVMRDQGRYTFRQFAAFPRRFYEMMVPASHRGGRGDPDRENTGPRASKKPSRTWDDEFTLKPTYSALIPIFDPRPGRTNVNQTQEIKLPVGVSDEELYKKEIGFKMFSNASNLELKPKDLRLYLKGPNTLGMDNATVEILDDEHKLLFYIHRILNLTNWYEHANNHKASKVWEPTFTLVYEVRGTTPSSVNVTQLDAEKISNGESLNAPVQRTLDSITFMKEFIEICGINLSSDALISSKLTQKITQEMHDPLLVSTNSLPEWGWFMLTKHKHLFSLTTRWNYLLATSFDTPRSVIWAQEVLDASTEQNQPGNISRRDDAGDFRIGRLLHERIRVPRGEKLFETALQVFKFHSVRKSVLEIQYFDEEGTGLGPTLEFFALVAAEFQRKERAMWICDDSDTHYPRGKPGVEDDNDEKPPSYYVRRPGGLFPAPIPPGTEESRETCKLFKVFGIFLGKIIQDKRIVDMPFALPLLRLLSVHPDSENGLLNELGIADFELLYPDKSKIIKGLEHFIEKRDKICVDISLSREQRLQKIQNLKLEIGSTKCSLEEIGLTFVVDPPSSVFQYRNYELIEDGANIVVTLNNVDVFFNKIIDFHLNTGIKPQIDSLREGFNLVCPLSALSLLTPDELLKVLCGDQSPQWTLEELLRHTVPKNGYTEDSRTFKNFCEVLADMDPNERKAFLQFATGCSSLPPGGLANLHPPLTIVRKGECGDGAFPSVNTCVHYCKMPDYSTKEILKERLSYATLQKCFYLN